MALTKAQLQLLRLLKDKDSEQGVFFARWDEIRSKKYSEQWLQSNKDAPNLDWETQRLLLDFIKQDLVDELEKWGTDEGKHYRITTYGIAALEGSEVSIILRNWPMVRGGLLWVVLPLVAAWLLHLFGPNLGIVETLGKNSQD